MAASQLAKPTLQIEVQTALVQIGIEFGTCGQTWPQAPQLLMLVSSAVSQPSAGLPLQLPKPGLQMTPQALLAQTGIPLACGGHTEPHAPQLLVSLNTFTHCPAHCSRGAVHTAGFVHTPAVQRLPLQQSEPTVQTAPSGLQTGPASSPWKSALRLTIPLGRNTTERLATVPPWMTTLVASLTQVATLLF